jgi:hypothetical protein
VRVAFSLGPLSFGAQLALRYNRLSHHELLLPLRRIVVQRGEIVMRRLPYGVRLAVSRRTSLNMNAALLAAGSSLSVEAARTALSGLSMSTALLAAGPSSSVEAAWTALSGLPVTAALLAGGSGLSTEAARTTLSGLSVNAALSGLTVMLLFLRLFFMIFFFVLRLLRAGDPGDRKT